MFSSAKRAHAIHPPVPQILSQLQVEMEMMPVPEDAMEAQPDVEMGTEPVRSGTKRISSTWEDCAGKINREACLNAVDERRRCDADEVLARVAGVRSEPTQMSAECSSGAADTKGHPWRQSSARERPIKPRETNPSQEL